MRRSIAFGFFAALSLCAEVATAQQQPPPQQPYPPQNPPQNPYGQPPPPYYAQPTPYAPPPGYYAPAPPPPPPPQESARRWYGWEDLPGIGASIGLFFLARGANDTDGKVILYTSAFLVGAVWNPAVHAFNDASHKKVKESFSLTTAGLAVGALVGISVAGIKKANDSNASPDAGASTLNGMEIGVCVASAIDLLLFAWTGSDKDDEKDAFVRPQVMFDGRRSFAGVAGTF